jgi:hypothetical protein
MDTNSLILFALIFIILALYIIWRIARGKRTR